MPFRIITFDGGTGTATYLRYLRALERDHPGFLARVDAFAGVSDGAVAALMLARYAPEARATEGLPAAIELADQLLHVMQPGLCGYARMLTGCKAALNVDTVHGLLAEAYGVDTTLRDLHAHVSAVAYRVRSPTGARLYDNYPGSPDLDLRLVDVAGRSGAFPALLPVEAGHVDGGMFAINPCAVALAHAASQQRDHQRTPDDVRMLSLGPNATDLGGRCVQAAFARDRTNWGWLPWFLHPTDPVLFFQMLFNADDGAASTMCRHLLGPSFLRVNVPGAHGVISGVAALMLRQASRVVQKAEQTAEAWRADPEDPRFHPPYAPTSAWVEKMWMGDG